MLSSPNDESPANVEAAVSKILFTSAICQTLWIEYSELNKSVALILIAERMER